MAWLTPIATQKKTSISDSLRLGKSSQSASIPPYSQRSSAPSLSQRPSVPIPQRSSAPPLPQRPFQTFPSSTPSSQYPSTSQLSSHVSQYPTRLSPTLQYPQFTYNSSHHLSNPLIPNCYCGEAATEHTVTKPGPNTGRVFYCCARPRENQCNFFQWADAPESSEPPRTDIMCNCGQPAAQRQVNKAGPNQGRSFYCCAKPKEQQCNFFQWADDAQNTGGSTLFRPPTEINVSCYKCGKRGHFANNCPNGNEKKDRRPYKETTRVRKPRVCSVCKQPGHTKKNCPMNQTTSDFQMDYERVDYGDMDMEELHGIDWEM